MGRIGTTVIEQQQKKVKRAAKEHICLTHGHGHAYVFCVDMQWTWTWTCTVWGFPEGVGGGWAKRGQRGKIGTIVIA